MTSRQDIITSIVTKRNIYGGVIFPISPLYVSSICQENCKYCNYRAANKEDNIIRKRLSDEELLVEIEYLVLKGYRVIELVYATDPLIDVSKMAQQINKTKEILYRQWGEGTVGINAKPFSSKEYKQLKNAGLDFVVLWMETYNKDNYKLMHIDNLHKKSYSVRYNAYEKMLDAGIRNIGMGVLLGLSNYEEDINELFAHIDILVKRYGEFNLILGVPRLKKAKGAEIKSTSHIVTDEDMITLITHYNKKYPFALPFLNTRESWDLNIKMARGGGVIFTFDCFTIPGGYSIGTKGYQFPTYSFPIEVYASRLINDLNLVAPPAQIKYNWNFNDITKIKEYTLKEKMIISA
jgi:2-iminoacetate synthase